MKLVILVALATVAAVSSYRPTGHSFVYKPGEQYVYHYKAQILNGIPKSSKQFSGLLLDTLVLLQFQQDSRVVMKLENIKLYKIDNKVSTEPSESITESETTRLTGSQELIIVQKLSMPVKFRYDDGEIRELQNEMTDKYWSVNIKKGLLSMIQVTLKEKHSLSSDSSIYYDPTMSRIKSYGQRSYGSSSSYWNPTTKTNSVYTVKETDVNGFCETKYTIISDKNSLSSSSSVMYVTAVRNFDSCTTKPFHIEGLFQGVPTTPTEKELIHPTVHTDYIITGDRSHFMIKEATRRGKYFVYVNGLEGADLSTYVYQKLTHKNTESISKPVHLVSPMADRRGLQMIIPKANLLPEKESYERSSGRYENVLYRKKVEQDYELKKNYEAEDFYQEERTGGDSDDIIPVVEQKLQQLIQCIYAENTEKKCSDLVMEVTIILREGKKEELKTIYNRYVRHQSSHRDTEKRISEILLNILPTLTTPDAANVLIELIREGHVTGLKKSLLINSMVLIVKPTTSVIRNLLELYKETPKEITANTLTTKALARQATLLGVGTLVHRLLVTMKSQGKPIPELVTFIDNISMEMKRLLEEANGDEEKILILKSMGNMGASENIMTLKKWIEDRNRVQSMVRINAIMALRRLAKDFKKQITPILMGVFMDMKEEREVRQAAFLVIIKSDPTYTTLQMIAHRINYDKSHQIRTLVYTNLVNLAFYTSHQPEHKTLIKNARLVLKTINPVYVGFYDSMTLFVNRFSDMYDMGAGLEVTKIKSKLSGYPLAIHGNLQGTLFGKHKTFLTAGVDGKAHGILLRKIFGPHGVLSRLLKGKVSLEDMLKPIVSSALGGVDLKVIDIMNKMRMERPVEEGIFANYFLHILENEMQYVTINSHNIDEWKNRMMTLIPEILMELRKGTEFDVVKTTTHQSSLTVATSMGVPLHLNHSIYGVFKMEGSVKISNLPTDLSSLWHQYKGFSLHQGWEEFKKFPIDIPSLNLDLKVKPFLDVSQYVSISSDLRWLMSGVGMENYMRLAKPFRLTTELNKETHSVSLKYYPTKETTPVVHLRGVPFMFINYIPTTTTRLPYTLEVKEIKNDEIVKTRPFNYQYECRMTGQTIQVQGTYSLCGPKWCPIMPLFGKQEFIIVTRPTSEVEFLELKLQSVRNNFEFEGIPSHLPTEELYEEFEQDFDVYDKESINYKTASRVSRRSALLTDDFEPITVDPIFQSETPIKRQIRLTLRPSNRQVEALKSQITWFMSHNYYVNQFNAQLIRSTTNDMPSWKIIKNTVVNPLAWYPEEIYRGNKGEFLTKTMLVLNINGEQKTFKVKVVPGSPFNFAEEMKQHKLWPIDADTESKTKTYKYTVELEFPQLNHRTTKMLMWIDNTFKYYFYDKLTTDISQVNLENKLIASAQIMPEWEKMNIIVKNPRENMYISNVPFYWNPFLPTNEKIKLHNHYAWNFYKQFQSDDLSLNELDHDLPYTYTPLLTKGQCKVDFMKKFVSTFDGVKYSIKPTLVKVHQEGCGLLTAQDCSKQGLFSLYVKARSEENWGLKLHLPRADIEVKVVDKRVSKVEVNGEVISLRETKIYTIPSVEDVVRSEHEIELVSEEEILIRAKELGLVVIVNQKEFTADVHISHSSMLWGNLCGLCGNNNQDPSDDLEIPRNLKVPSSRPFYLSHLIPSDTCNLDNPTVLTDYCQKTTFLTIRRHDNEVPMKCTSERKIVQCSEGCRPAQVRSVKTCFKCQTESDMTLTRRSYYQPSVLLPLEDGNLTCEEFSERLEVPTTCEPIY